MSDGNQASVSLAPRQVSQALTVKNLGFNFPDNTDIKGIEVRVLGVASATGIVDVSVQLLRPAGAPLQGASTTPAWATGTTSERVYGGAADSWGVAAWNPTAINSSAFGFSLVVGNAGGAPATALVDTIVVTVYADVPGFTSAALFPASGASDSKYGGPVAWSAPSNARTLDGQFAAVAVSGLNESAGLFASAFATPPIWGMTLSGIAVDVRRRVTMNGAVADSHVQLVNGGNLLGLNRARSGAWDAPEGWARYGGLRDLWGMSPSAAAAMLTAGTLDFTLSVRAVSGFPSAEVDAIRLLGFYNVALNMLDSSATAMMITSELFARPWSNPADALVAGDNAFATSSTLRRGDLTEALVASSFGFSIPPNATVQGVEFHVWRRAQAGSALLDQNARVVGAAGPVGADRASAVPWSNMLIDQIYGGPSDTLGATLGPADVNAASFGFLLSVANPSGPNDVPLVDAIQARVTYSCP